MAYSGRKAKHQHNGPRFVSSFGILATSSFSLEDGATTAGKERLALARRTAGRIGRHHALALMVTCSPVAVQDAPASSHVWRAIRRIVKIHKRRKLTLSHIG